MFFLFNLSNIKIQLIMNNLVKNILILVAILFAAGLAWKLVFVAVKWVLIGGGLYLGYRLFISNKKQVKGR